MSYIEDIEIVKKFCESNGKINYLPSLKLVSKLLFIDYAQLSLTKHKKNNKHKFLAILALETFGIEPNIKPNLEKKRIKTKHFKSIIDEKTSTFYYDLLKNSVNWDKGIKDKYNKETRPAKNIEDIENEDIVNMITELIFKALDKINFISKNEYKQLIIHDQYINYYVSGNNYTPMHSHHGLVQIVISLGTTRTLIIGKKEYKSENGDVFVFGSSTHGVPKEEKIKEGRISIALFCKLL